MEPTEKLVGTVGRRQVAARLAYSYDRFGRVWRAMVRERGFPAPTRPAHWEGEAVEAWIRAQAARSVDAAPAARASKSGFDAAWDQIEQAQRQG